MTAKPSFMRPERPPVHSRRRYKRLPPDQRRPRDRSLAQVPSSGHHIADAIVAAHYTDDQRAPPLFKTEGVPEIPDPFVFGLGWRNMTRHSSPHCITDFYRFLPIFTDFSDFLGRLQPSKTTIQKTPGTLGVEESSSPRRVLHF